jgi:hypothetical protein
MHFHALCVQPHVALAVCCLRCWGSSSRVVCRVYQAVANADLPCGVLPPVLGAVAGPLSACHDGARLSPQCVSVCSMWGLLSALRAASSFVCCVCGVVADFGMLGLWVSKPSSLAGHEEGCHSQTAGRAFGLYYIPACCLDLTGAEAIEQYCFVPDTVSVTLHAPLGTTC